MQKIECKLCKNYYGQLSRHIRCIHKIDPKDYYDTYYGKHLCPVCNKETKFINVNLGYKKYHKCCAQKSEEVKKKISETCKSEETIAKVKATCNKKYGTDFAFQAKETKQKIKESMLNHYGVESAMQSEELRKKHRKSMKKHYGVEYALQNENIYNKIRQTNLDRYGVEIFTKSKEYGVSKANSTLKNGKLNKMEQFLVNILNKNNITYILEYKDYDKYPYFCDFYLPKTDTYVELHNYWMHQDHFYDKDNIEDQKLLARLQEKAKEKSIYRRAIQIWTISDIEKLECAKKNNLNYVVLRNKEDINSWIKDYIKEI